MKILRNLLVFLSENKKSIVYVLLFLVFIFHTNDFAFATDATTKTADKDKNVILNALNLFLGMVGSILALLTMLIGVFLRPEWTSGSVIGLDTQLKTMWIMISNVVYFVFAGIFVTIAFMNIIGHGDNYELKKALPKFIVGVLIVPFSWFFVQFILSLSSIMTVAVLSLPYDTFPELKIGDSEMEICKAGYKINLSATGSNIIACEGGAKPDSVTLKELIKEGDNGGLYQIMMVYTYGVMKLDAKGKLFSKEIAGGITDLSKLTAKAVFDIVFVLVYCILLVALFLAFMSRGVALWFYVMFSPVFGLLHYFGKGKDGMGEGAAKKFNLHEFIALAFVPVYVAGALAFGLVFLYTTGKGLSSDATVGADKVFEFKGDKLTVKGSVPLSFDAILTKPQEDKDEVKKVFGNFKGVVGTMLLQMLGLAVLWLAVMAALKQSSITANVTSPIAEFGDQIGKLMSKAPTYAPILPGGQSVQSLAKAGGTLTSVPDALVNNKAAPLQEKINRTFGVSTVDTGTLAKFNNLLADGKINDRKEFDELRSMYLKGVEEFGHNDKNVTEMRKKLLEAMKTSDGSIKNYITQKSGFSDFANLNTTDLSNIDANKALLLSQDRAQAEKLGLALSKGMFKSGEGEKTIAGDVNQSTIDFNEAEGVKIGNDIKIKAEKGVGNIAIRQNNEKESINLSLNFGTTFNSKTFTGNDLDDAVALYKALGKNDENFKTVFEKLGYTNSKDLLDEVKKSIK